MVSNTVWGTVTEIQRPGEMCEGRWIEEGNEKC